MKHVSHGGKTLRSWFAETAVYPTTERAYDLLVLKSKRNALALFHNAAARVPAYEDFLRKHNVKSKTIRTYQEFCRVPLTTKENYIEVYDAKKRSWDGTYRGVHMVSTSSGTTGEPHYWPRSLRHDIDGAIIHEFFLRNIFHIDDISTLFINGFALGNWIAGTFTSASVALVAWKGYPLTVMSPGYDKDAVIKTILDMAPAFEQTIVTGHTPFLKEIAEEVGSFRTKKRLHIRFLGTGQGVTEAWRNTVTKRIGGVDPHSTVINLYGSADASLMGFETPVSIALRRVIEEKEYGQAIFENERLPSLYQFDPTRTFFEEVDHELCITKDSGSPLIRYNIHDTGGVIAYSQLTSRVRESEVMMQREKFPWQLPFVYLFGREKFMVKIYGANIYTEHVQKALDHPSLQHHVTGRFLLDTGYDERQNPRLIVRIELSGDRTHEPRLRKIIAAVFVEQVSKVNSEYRFIMSRMGEKAKPHVELYPHGHQKYFPKGVIRKTA